MNVAVKSLVGLTAGLALGWCLVLLGCDPEPFPGGGGGGGLDDGLGDTDVVESMCDTYPTADNNFAVGSVIRNYELFDREDDDAEICEFAKPSATLLFLALTAES
jgi:hypothetical protein